MSVDHQAVYQQFGTLLESMPLIDIGAFGTSSLSLEAHKWIARAEALVTKYGGLHDNATWHSVKAILYTSSWQQQLDRMLGVLHTIMAKAELECPQIAQGVFIPVNKDFDTFSSLKALFESAECDVLIVDPYLDASVLTDFGCTVPEGVTLRLLTDSANYRNSLEPAYKKWCAQYQSARPLEVRFTLAKALHDRMVFVDNQQVWTLSQSLKDFAKRSPATIVRADSIADLKIAAYQSIWSASSAEFPMS